MVTERLTGAEIAEVYKQLGATEHSPLVACDLFAKWFSSRHSELALKIKGLTKALKWGELAPLTVYTNPDEEPEIAEQRFQTMKKVAKGTFILSTFALRATYKTTKTAYNIAKPVTQVAVKTAMPIIKTTMQATHMVTSTLDSTIAGYSAAGNALFSNLDEALFAELTDEEKAGKVLFKLLDADKNKTIERVELDKLNEVSGLHVGDAALLDGAFDEMMGWTEPESVAVDRRAFMSWYESSSRLASRLRRESVFAVNKEKAEQAREARAALVPEVGQPRPGPCISIAATSGWVSMRD
jgi:DNA primase